MVETSGAIRSLMDDRAGLLRENLKLQSRFNREPMEDKIEEKYNLCF